MKNIIIVTIALFVLLGTALFAESGKAVGLKLNKSIIVVSENVSYLDGNNDQRQGELMSSTIGLGANLVYKIRNNYYLDVTLAYTSYTFSNIPIYKDNKKLEASSIDLIVDYSYYLSSFDEFTPYVAFGGGFVFMTSNESELTYIKDTGGVNFLEDSDTYLSEMSLLLNAKIGLHIPVNEKFVVNTEFDFVAVLSTNYGVIPKLSFGGSYIFN